jgi:hypothetical protein
MTGYKLHVGWWTLSFLLPGLKSSMFSLSITCKNNVVVYFTLASYGLTWDFLGFVSLNYQNKQAD